MFWWKNRFNMLMDAKGDGDGGGGGGGGDAGKKDDSSKGKSNDKSDDSDDDSDADKAEYEEFKKWKASKSNDRDSDLTEKSRREREASDKSKADNKSFESAVTFNLTAKDFLKNNAALLPESIKDLFDTADKESWDSPVQKASEIKSGIVQEFFAVQQNHDLLTAAQKGALADYLKLTKDGKRDKAQNIYDSIFEPALERLRDAKKAEQVNRARNGYGDDSDQSYREKLITGSRKHYLGTEK